MRSSDVPSAFVAGETSSSPVDPDDVMVAEPTGVCELPASVYSADGHQACDDSLAGSVGRTEATDGEQGRFSGHMSESRSLQAVSPPGHGPDVGPVEADGAQGAPTDVLEMDGAAVDSPSQLPMSVVVSLAAHNRARIGSFARDSHFPQLHPAETDLLIAIFYVVCNQHGAAEACLLQRPRALPPHLVPLRVLACGTRAMHLAPRGERNFAIELQPCIHVRYNAVQQAVMAVTQDLLLQRADWFTHGFSSVELASPPVSPTSPGSPRSPQPAGGSAAEKDGGRAAACSPPGHTATSPPAVQRVPLARLAAAADRIAIGNLQQLDRAQVLQTAATLFVDSCGRLRHVLYGRPNQAALQFLAGQEDESEPYLSVVQVALAAERVHIAHPCEPLNEAQTAVVCAMRRILDAVIA